MNNTVEKPNLIFPCNQSDIEVYNHYNSYILFLENSIKMLFKIIEPSDNTDMNIEFTISEQIRALTEFLEQDNLKLK